MNNFYEPFIKARYNRYLIEQGKDDPTLAAQTASAASEYDRLREQIWQHSKYMYCWTAEEVAAAVAAGRAVVLASTWTQELSTHTGNTIAAYWENDALSVRVGTSLTFSFPAKKGGPRVFNTDESWSWGLNKLRFHVWMTLVNFKEPRTGMNCYVVLYDVPEPPPFVEGS